MPQLPEHERVRVLLPVPHVELHGPHRPQSPQLNGVPLQCMLSQHQHNKHGWSHGMGNYSGAGACIPVSHEVDSVALPEQSAPQSPLQVRERVLRPEPHVLLQSPQPLQSPHARGVPASNR